MGRLKSIALLVVLATAAFLNSPQALGTGSSPSLAYLRHISYEEYLERHRDAPQPDAVLVIPAGEFSVSGDT